jgi:hypothetical protein
MGAIVLDLDDKRSLTPDKALATVRRPATVGPEEELK